MSGGLANSRYPQIARATELIGMMERSLNHAVLAVESRCVNRAGNFSITGGFGAGFQDLPDDLPDDSAIFGDGFESGDLLAWSNSLDD